MSNREEFEKWAKYLFCGYSFNFCAGEYDDAEIDSAYMGWKAATASLLAKLDEANAEIAYLKSYIEGCNDSFATIMAEKEKYKAEIARLKSVSLEPVFLWHKVDNEDECDVFDCKDIGHTDCQHCIPLYTAEQINKMATKEWL